jgi:hypothetical protein
VVIRLAVTARKYQKVVARYLAFYENLSRLSKAFGLLNPMERAFEMWFEPRAQRSTSRLCRFHLTLYGIGRQRSGRGSAIKLLSAMRWLSAQMEHRLLKSH